ncbi:MULTISPECIES: replication restart helicase PriA [Thermodesulfovibrio]|jgi:primosomal protein N' (replication factor Y)|uniref:replication restart helicase PriA n=1 Tax=Thermodesulfovibrio TaxID=28261 RepID=UPI0026391116|nr:primosomal protein N' [Thermodesulfovibrio sp.]
MPYYDVSIPLKLKILTYYDERDEDLTGYAVKVPLKNRLCYGIVIEKRKEKPEEVESIKKIEKVLGWIYSKNFIDFLRWMSFYYICELGSIVRLTFFDELIAFLEGKTGKPRGSKHSKNRLIEKIAVNEQTLATILEAFKIRDYRAFLLHTPNVSYEKSLFLHIAEMVSFMEGQVLFILPEIREVESLYHSIVDRIGDKAVMLHSEMRTSEKLKSIERLMKENIKVIVGTRFALFTPTKNLSLIALSQESSWLYKAEEAPRYHTRESAIMRGFIEKCPVVLCDTMPSVSSFWNSTKGKFEYIDDFNRYPHPEILILKQPLSSIFHPEALLNLKLNKKEGVIIVSPRTGFSLLRCSECGEVIKCQGCGGSMLFHKEKNFTECKRCNSTEKTPEFCPTCGGAELHYVGTGTERLLEELKKTISDSDVILKDYSIDDEQIEGISITTSAKLKKSSVHIFKTAVFVDFDFFLSLPDYRALENAFSKVLSLCHLIRNDGNITIQTRNPENEFFRYLKSYDFKGFYHYELKHRRETLFPPFVRLIKIVLKTNKKNTTEKLDEIKNLIKEKTKADLIGPLGNRDESKFSYILRSQNKKELTEAVNNCIKWLRKMRGIEIVVEVDPANLKQ